MAPTVRAHHSDPARAVRRAASDALTVLGDTHGHVIGRVRDIVANRPSRLWLGMIGMPLLLCAALLSNQWWAIVPVSVGAWWCGADDWQWAWVAAVGRGLLATEWAAIGANALAAFPAARPVVATAWVGAAAFFALVSRSGANS